jgi:phenylpyruvate tautomerase PptA (4-oxalocrotonate tautomerase family)
MPYIQVDIELDEFDTDDLVQELTSRIKASGRKRLTDKQKAELMEDLKDLYRALGLADDSAISVKTLDDKMKIEHLSSVWNRYSSSEIEQRLPA